MSYHTDKFICPYRFHRWFDFYGIVAISYYFLHMGINLYLLKPDENWIHYVNDYYPAPYLHMYNCDIFRHLLCKYLVVIVGHTALVLLIIFPTNCWFKLGLQFLIIILCPKILKDNAKIYILRPTYITVY